MNVEIKDSECRVFFVRSLVKCPEQFSHCVLRQQYHGTRRRSHLMKVSTEVRHVV
jgi:hypothetical protein